MTHTHKLPHLYMYIHFSDSVHFSNFIELLGTLDLKFQNLIKSLPLNDVSELIADAEATIGEEKRKRKRKGSEKWQR